MGRTNQQRFDITAQDIENSISLVDIVSKYTQLKQKGTKFEGLCPFHDDTQLGNFSVKNNIFKCFSCGIGGKGVIDFVKKKEGITFQEAISKLSKEYNITGDNKIKVVKKPVIDIPIDIDFVSMPFSQAHLNYWASLDIDESFLARNNVFAVEKWAIGYKSRGTMRVIDKIGDEITFCYHAEDIDKEKILRIGSNIDKRDKWMGNIPNNYLWYIDEYQDCDKLYVVKSIKDCLVLKKLGLCAIAVQSENAVILLSNKEKIESKSKNIILVFGIDKQAIKERDIILENTNWKSWKLNESLCTEYGITDPTEYIQAGFSYKQLFQELNNI